jgi:DNA-binding MarR family transcriptional regulator
MAEGLYPDTREAVCNCTALRKAARRLTRFYDACLAEVGLRGTQYAILLYLSRQGATTIGALADAMVTDRTTAGHTIKPLERDHLVSIDVDPADRRSRLISLTEQGARKVEDGRKAWNKAQRIFETSFGEGAARDMRKTMADVAGLELDHTVDHPDNRQEGVSACRSSTDVEPRTEAKEFCVPKLSGKTALVTGASRGIGRASALALAEAEPRSSSITDRALKRRRLSSSIAPGGVQEGAYLSFNLASCGFVLHMFLGATPRPESVRVRPTRPPHLRSRPRRYARPGPSGRP